MKAEQALQRLIDGNRRFAEGKSSFPNSSPARRRELSQAQNPFACILGCADSRVPPELIFDCGLGDLFVFRTAGHVVDRAVIGSITFAVDVLGVPLLMVLGHTDCGAVKAAIQVTQGSLILDPELENLVNQVRPAVEHAAGMEGELLDRAVRENVKLTVEQIQAKGPFTPTVSKDKLQVVGAIYDLSAGLVEIIC